VLGYTHKRTQQRTRASIAAVVAVCCADLSEHGFQKGQDTGSLRRWESKGHKPLAEERAECGGEAKNQARQEKLKKVVHEEHAPAAQHSSTGETVVKDSLGVPVVTMPQGVLAALPQNHPVVHQVQAHTSEPE